MMKEICAQCLQPHVDPQTGKTSYVFSCFNQDQLLDQVDFGALAQRLAQNGVQEKLTALWIGRCLKKLPPPVERKAACDGVRSGGHSPGAADRAGDALQPPHRRSQPGATGLRRH
jgi:hypothetical protein